MNRKIKKNIKKTMLLVLVVLCVAPFVLVWKYQKQPLKHVAYADVPMRQEIYNFLKIITSKKLQYIHQSGICDFPRGINGDLIDYESYSVDVKLIPNSNRGAISISSKDAGLSVRLLTDFKECTNNLLNAKFDKLNLALARRYLDILKDPSELSLRDISSINDTQDWLQHEIAAVEYSDAKIVIYETIVVNSLGSYIAYITIAISLCVIAFVAFKRGS